LSLSKKGLVSEADGQGQHVRTRLQVESAVWPTRRSNIQTLLMFSLDNKALPPTWGHGQGPPTNNTPTSTSLRSTQYSWPCKLSHRARRPARCQGTQPGLSDFIIIIASCEAEDLRTKARRLKVTVHSISSPALRLADNGRLWVILRHVIHHHSLVLTTLAARFRGCLTMNQWRQHSPKCIGSSPVGCLRQNYA
jgi:hypothetical protein